MMKSYGLIIPLTRLGKEGLNVESDKISNSQQQTAHLRVDDAITGFNSLGSTPEQQVQDRDILQGNIGQQTDFLYELLSRKSGSINKKNRVSNSNASRQRVNTHIQEKKHKNKLIREESKTLEEQVSERENEKCNSDGKKKDLQDTRLRTCYY